MIPEMKFAYISWEAFGTLATGLLAVGAALAVGLRQQKVIERQTTLTELQLRTNLFERRYGVYDATKSLLVEILAHADRASAETERRFIVGLNDAKFLFRNDVESELRRIWRLTCSFNANHSVMSHNFKTLGHYGDNGEVDREHEYLDEINRTLEGLADAFGDEIRLAD